MKLRLILSCTLLLLAAAPTFALPLCEDCNEWNFCEPIPGASIERCYDGPGYCFTTTERCSIPNSATVLTEWQVASVDVQRPSQDAFTVTAQTQAPKKEVRQAELVAAK